MEASYENIILVCLDGNFGRLISEELSGKLDMFFADLKAYIEYDLLDSKEVLEVCGVEYFQKREYSAAKHFARFTSSILTVDFDLFKQNRSAFTNNSFIVYLKLPKKALDKNETTNIIAFDAHDIYLQKECDLTIELKNKTKSKSIKEIITKLGEVI